jgi:cyclase
MAEYEPRYADQIFEQVVTFQGSKRHIELRSLGRGHSEEDIVLLLPQDKLAFIGDIGFFDMQPFLGFCDIDRYRQQLHFFQDSDYQVLVPGHGPVGGKQDLELQLGYFDVMEDLVGNVAHKGGSFEEALRITLPEPFDQWLAAGMGRFKANVAYLFARFGGEVPELE